MIASSLVRSDKLYAAVKGSDTDFKSTLYSHVVMCTGQLYCIWSPPILQRWYVFVNQVCTWHYVSFCTGLQLAYFSNQFSCVCIPITPTGIVMTSFLVQTSVPSSTKTLNIAVLKFLTIYFAKAAVYPAQKPRNGLKPVTRRKVRKRTNVLSSFRLS